MRTHLTNQGQDVAPANQALSSHSNEVDMSRVHDAAVVREGLLPWPGLREGQKAPLPTDGVEEDVQAGHIHFVAVRAERLVGWCDILPLIGQMRAHAGVLGMAVAADSRGQGIGRQLIQAALAQAAERSLTRVELTVHSENVNAQALYKSVGFELEGTQRRGWCLDGQYFDVHYMARVA